MSGSADPVSDDIDVRSVLDALPRAVIVTRPDGRILMWNLRAEALYGWRADEVLGRPINDLLVAVPDRHQAQEILDVVGSGDTWTGDFTVLRRNGDPVRVWVTDRPIQDATGATIAIVGASEDVAEQRLLEQRAADLTEHLRLALEAGRLGTFRWDIATGATEWDERLEAHFGLGPGEFDGTYDTYVSLLHPESRDSVLAAVQEAVASKGRYSVEHRVVWADGTVHWLQGSGQVTLDAAGDVTGTIGCVREVTEQVVADQERQRLIRESIEATEQERISRERLEFLGTINDAIATSRDQAELMGNVTRAAIPRLGDWCSLFVLPEAGARVPDIETAHADPAMVAHAKELRDRFPFDPDATIGMPNVIRTGLPQFYPMIDEALISELDASDEERDVVRDLVLRSSIAVPLTQKGEILGGLQLIMTKSRRQYTEDDLTLAQAVAARIASSLANLRLADEQRAIASTLQASLLPRALPEIPSVEVAVRYWANGENVEVGGDFYDVFKVGDACWALVIGDVCGTGPTAAAVTGLARHTIASAAWHGDDHVEVLTNLNRAMRQRDAERFCTAVYATLRQTPDGLSFAFACGGHPLPIIARAGGSAAPCGTPGSLLGVFDGLNVTTTTTSLHSGDTVVLYTDGVTDVAPPNGLTPQELSHLIGRISAETGSAEETADSLHAALSSVLPLDKRDDDIALLILRVR